MVMSMYMGEYFSREAEQATCLLQLYETTVFSHPRFERKVAKTAQEDLQYWRKQLLIAEQLDVLLDKVCGGTSQHSSLFTEERSALEAACNKLEKSLQQ